MSSECAEFDRRLQRLLDRRRWPQTDRRLLRHARHCAACRQMLAAQVLICEHLALAPRSNPPGGLAARVLTSWQSERAAGWHGAAGWRGAASWKYAGALAAALLLAVWHWGWLRTPPDRPATGPAALPERVASQRSGTAAPLPLAPEALDGDRDLLAPAVLVTGSAPSPAARQHMDLPAARQRMKLLAAETGQSLAAVVLRLPIVRSGSADGEPAASDQDSPWVESMTGSLKPFAESLSDAVTPWLQTAPQGPKSEG